MWHDARPELSDLVAALCAVTLPSKYCSIASSASAGHEKFRGNMDDTVMGAEAGPVWQQSRGIT